ncbi:MAG: hypothetical protein V1721_02540 [Pseudomonadota bacterium]
MIPTPDHDASIPIRHAAAGRHPVRRSRIYKGASRSQTPPFGGVAKFFLCLCFKWIGD